jgi:PRTRC genetic system ThiF family protein
MEILTPTVLVNPNHPIPITLIGMGGTGSILITKLAMLDKTLKALGHIGLSVTAYDNDLITSSNIGRQLFPECDLGRNKAISKIESINLFFGLNWAAVPEKYDFSEHSLITITCTDTKKSRKDFYNKEWKQKRENFWIDCGNGLDYGQVICGSTLQLTATTKEKICLNTIIDIYPGYLSSKEEKSIPSCSLAEAVGKQSLFVNSFVADLCANLLYDYLVGGIISYNAIFFDLKEINFNKMLSFSKKS